MNFDELISFIDYLARYLHIVFGIAWIGLLYYFNFCSTVYLASAPQDSKISMITTLMPRVLWWFRWAAAFTFVTGAYLVHVVWNAGTLKEDTIIAGVMATIMAINVWFVIWPNQRVVIQSHENMRDGIDPLPDQAACGAAAFLASRTNTLLSLPMVATMVSSAHYHLGGQIETNSYGMFIALALVLLIWINSLFGKINPLIQGIPAVITSGFVLTGITMVLLYVW